MWQGKYNLRELSEKLVTEHGVLIIPGEFFAPAPLSDAEGVEGREWQRDWVGPVSCHFRLGFGRKNFPECLEALQQALLVILCDGHGGSDRNLTPSSP